MFIMSMEAQRETNERHCSNDVENLRHVLRLVAALSSERNLKLFQLAKNGLRFDYEALSRLKLSRKQYYKGISQLQMLGLIHKVENRYYQSTLGLALYQSMSSLSGLFVHRQVMQVVDVCHSMHLDPHGVVDSLAKGGALDPKAAALIASGALSGHPRPCSSEQI